MSRTAIVWFRRDLRLHDHPALTTATREYERVVPVFVLDDRLLHERYAAASSAAAGWSQEAQHLAREQLGAGVHRGVPLPGHDGDP